jgi:hypothetical protein
MGSNDWTDRFGSVASSVCAIHCALCAFLPVAFSAVGLGFLLGQQVEWLFAIVAILFGLAALVLGWRQHRSTRVAVLLISGVVGIMISRGLEMGSDHHDHGSDSHHEVIEHTEATATGAHQAEEHHDEHHDEHDGADSDHSDGHDEGEDAAHLIGALVGVLAGLILLMGHLLNIRETRRCREECST